MRAKGATNSTADKGFFESWSVNKFRVNGLSPGISVVCPGEEVVPRVAVGGTEQTSSPESVDGGQYMSLVNDVIGQFSRDALSVKNDWPVFVDG